MSFFGFLTLGVVIGVISRLIYRKRGMKMVPSMIIGAISALVGGSLNVYFELTYPWVYAAISAMLVIFTTNSFRKETPIFTDSEN